MAEILSGKSTGINEPSRTQAEAARLRMRMDADLGRQSPEEIRRIAASPAAAEPERCECDRPDQRDDPHRHDFSVACVYWIAGRPSRAARIAAVNERRRPTATEAYGDQADRADRAATLTPEPFADVLTADIADSMRDPDYAEVWKGLMRIEGWSKGMEQAAVVAEHVRPDDVGGPDAARSIRESAAEGPWDSMHG